MKENNFQLFFLGQTKHIVKPRHCYTYALLSRRHNIILELYIQKKSKIFDLCYFFNDEFWQIIALKRMITHSVISEGTITDEWAHSNSTSQGSKIIPATQKKKNF